ncbi:MAG: hypothetical protein QS98_C0003G0020 [archaeon GW2011_AR3]|nr:MAG: hypothetical protein QS98_C0003G0020 [archaeon GW2011_AR3]MBS3110063.1 hypothetical protein [Candidatus Woesearchaeota archaeon]
MPNQTQFKIIFFIEGKLKAAKLLLQKEGVKSQFDIPIAPNRISTCNGIFLRLNEGDKYEWLKVNLRDNSPYYLVKSKEGFAVTNEAGDKLTDSVGLFNPYGGSRIFTPQLSGVYAVSLFGCELINLGTDCKFCASPAYQGMKYSRTEFGDELRRINAVRQIDSVTVNAGSIVTKKDRGYAMMAPYIQILKQERVKSVNLELMPPTFQGRDLDSFLENAREDGVTSLQFNIEVWDKDKRLQIMPYKGKIPTEDYLATINRTAVIFGPGKASSGLIACLNDIDELRIGANAIIDADGIPTIDMFRSLSGTKLANLNPTVNYKPLLVLEKEINQRLIDRYGTNFSKTLEGCLKCGGCNTYGENLPTGF